jgi:hypothetical protein
MPLPSAASGNGIFREPSGRALQGACCAGRIGRSATGPTFSSRHHQGHGVAGGAFAGVVHAGHGEGHALARRVPTASRCEDRGWFRFARRAATRTRRRGCLRYGGSGVPARTGLGVRGHVRALELGDMSPSRKAATCRRTPKPPAPVRMDDIRPRPTASRMGAHSNMVTRFPARRRKRHAGRGHHPGRA